MSQGDHIFLGAHEELDRDTGVAMVSRCRDGVAMVSRSWNEEDSF